MKRRIGIKVDDYIVAVGSLIINSKIEKVKEIKYNSPTEIKVILESGLSIDHYWFKKTNHMGWAQFRLATQDEIEKFLKQCEKTTS